MIRFPAGQRFPESRRAPRYPIAAPAALIEPVSKQHVQGWTTVISETGCYVRAADTLPSGAVAQLRIEREGGSLESWVRVAHAVPATGMGLAFFDMEQSQRETLKSWIDEVTVVMQQEIEKTTELAGFTQLRADNSVRAIFGRGRIIEAWHDQFPVNPRRAPGWVFGHHAKNQCRRENRFALDAQSTERS